MKSTTYVREVSNLCSQVASRHRPISSAITTACLPRCGRPRRRSRMRLVAASGATCHRLVPPWLSMTTPTAITATGDEVPLGIVGMLQTIHPAIAGKFGNQVSAGRRNKPRVVDRQVLGHKRHATTDTQPCRHIRYRPNLKHLHKRAGSNIDTASRKLCKPRVAA